MVCTHLFRIVLGIELVLKNGPVESWLEEIREVVDVRVFLRNSDRLLDNILIGKPLDHNFRQCRTGGSSAIY